MRVKLPCGLRQAGGLRRTDPVGLTLIELLVVIAIIAILGAIVFTSISRVRDVKYQHQTTTALTVFTTINLAQTAEIPRPRDIPQIEENFLSLF
jgi:prepilin-type N-terminal cleavage/methylation domain-containing protein